MKKFDKDKHGVVFQGEAAIFPVEKLPDGLKQRADKIVAHSETGHHHEFPAEAEVFLYSTVDPLISFMEVKAPSKLEHKRDFDTHETVLFDVGTYEIHRQREDSPEGWKIVVD